MSCALPRSLGLRGPSFGIEASRRGRDYMIAATLDSFPFSWGFMGWRFLTGILRCVLVLGRVWVLVLLFTRFIFRPA